MEKLKRMQLHDNATQQYIVKVALPRKENIFLQAILLLIQKLSSEHFVAVKMQ